MVHPTVHLSVLQRQHTRAEFNRRAVAGETVVSITGSATRCPVRVSNPVPLACEASALPLS